MHFSQGSIPENLVEKKFTIDKFVQCLLKVTTSIKYKKYTQRKLRLLFIFNDKIYSYLKKSHLALGILVNFIIQKLRSKHLVCLSFLWVQVLSSEQEKISYTYSRLKRPPKSLH